MKPTKPNAVHGEKNGRAKLSEADIRLILDSSETSRELAKKLGVGPTAVQQVRRGRSWKHALPESFAPREKRHGFARRGAPLTPEYRAWKDMKRRCHSPQDKCYYRYGGRGIRVADVWLNDFPRFLADVGNRPSSEHSLDRIDNERGYEPGNVRWATRAEQVRNTRQNVLIEHDGRSMCMTDWAAELGWSLTGLMYRLKVHPKERAMLPKALDPYRLPKGPTK